MQLNTLGVVHTFLKQYVQEGDFCIDAMRLYCEEKGIEIDEEYDIDDIIEKLEEYDEHKEDLVPIFINYIESYYSEE